MGLLPKKSFVGLDLGHYRMKAVQIDRSPSGWKITRSISAPTPIDTIKDGIVIDTAVLGLAIKNMLKEGHIHATSASIAVSGGTVVVRPVRIPKMAEASLRKSIRFEASRYVPNSIEDSFIEFEIIGDADATNMDILVAAAPKEIVETRVKACEAAGLSVESVEIAAFASYRSIVQANQDHDWNAITIAMIDIGSNLTNMSVIDKGTFSMTRSIPSGGHVFTEALKSYFKLSEADAEVGKTQLDVSQLIDQGATMENPPLRVLHSHLDDLVREVRRSMNYWQSQQGEGPSLRQIDMLVLCGGGMKLQGLHRYFEHKLGIKCLSLGIYDNPRFVSTHPSEDRGLDLAVAVGLAMATTAGEKKKAPAKKNSKKETSTEETEVIALKPGKAPKPPKPPKPPKKSKKDNATEESVNPAPEVVVSEPEVLAPAAAFVPELPPVVAPAAYVAPTATEITATEVVQPTAYTTPEVVAPVEQAPAAFAPPVVEVPVEQAPAARKSWFKNAKAEKPVEQESASAVESEKAPAKKWFGAPKAAEIAAPVEALTAEEPASKKSLFARAPKAAAVEENLASIETTPVEKKPKPSLFSKKPKASSQELVEAPAKAKKPLFGKAKVDETTLEGTFVAVTEVAESKPTKTSFFSKKAKVDETAFEGTFVELAKATVDKPAKQSLFGKKPKLEEAVAEAAVPKRSFFSKAPKVEAENLGAFVEVAPEAVVATPKKSLFGKKDKSTETNLKVEKLPKEKKIKAEKVKVEKAPKAVKPPKAAKEKSSKPAFSLFAKKQVFVEVAPTEVPGTYVKVEKAGSKGLSLFGKNKEQNAVVPKPIKPSKDVHPGFSFLKKKAVAAPEASEPSVNELLKAYAAARSTEAETAQANRDAEILKDLQKQEGILPGTTFPLLRKAPGAEAVAEAKQIEEVTVAPVEVASVAEVAAPVVAEAAPAEFVAVAEVVAPPVQAPMEIAAEVAPVLLETPIEEVVAPAATFEAPALTVSESDQQVLKAKPKARQFSLTPAVEEVVAEAPSQVSAIEEPKAEPTITAQGYMFIGGQMTYIASTSATSTNPERAA